MKRLPYAVVILAAVLLLAVVENNQSSNTRGEDKNVAASRDPKLSERIERLIRGLDDDEFKVRKRSEAELIKIGKPALDAVKKATKSSSAEVRVRAKRVIQKIVEAIQKIDAEILAKKCTSVDIHEKFNQKLSDNFSNNKGNSLTVSQGTSTLGGVRFTIGEGVIQLGSQVLSEKPEKVKDIKLDKKFVTLHILHATGFGGGPSLPGTHWYVKDDTLIGEYKIHYEDKSVETIPIVYGKDVRDWWFRKDEKEPSRSKVAWKGDNKYSNRCRCRLRLYLTSWKNPKPDSKVVSIDYIGRKNETMSAPFCVAITVEKK